MKWIWMGLLNLALMSDAWAQHEMSYRQMADLMQMDDTSRFAFFLFVLLVWRVGGANEGRAAWDAQGYYGGDYDKLWIKTEGKYVSHTGVHDATAEVLWDRVISKWWDVQVGARQDLGPGQSRTWGAIGIQGLTPQWFQTEASIYASDEGRTAARGGARGGRRRARRRGRRPGAGAGGDGRPD